MKLTAGHRWNLTPRQASALQVKLRRRLRFDDSAAPLRYVAGVDVGFEQAGTIARAGVVVLSLPDLAVVDCAIARAPTRFPYVPGLLSFREIPVILQALRRLRIAPDALLCDGHGYAHPRRFGLACHLGLIADLPCVGVAKTLLIGTHDAAPEDRGAWSALTEQGELIGAVLRSRAGVKPLYISVGHRVTLPRAIELVMACTTRFRLPETTRWAHRLASSPAAVSATIARTLRARQP